MAKRLSDLSLRKLRKLLRDAERVAGRDSQSARILRRAVSRQEKGRKK